MRTASEGRDTHMLKQPGHFTSMKKEFGDCTRRFSLWRFSSSSRGGCSRSISPIEMPACESRERARGLSAKSERYERRPQAGQRSANAEESPAAVAAVQRQICRRSASDGVGAAKRWYHYQLRADHRRAARAGHPSATRTMVAAAVNSASDVQDDRVARSGKSKLVPVGSLIHTDTGFGGCGFRGTRRAGTWDVDHPDHLVLLRRVAASSCSAVSGSSFPW